MGPNGPGAFADYAAGQTNKSRVKNTQMKLGDNGRNVVRYDA